MLLRAALVALALAAPPSTADPQGSAPPAEADPQGDAGINEPEPEPSADAAEEPAPTDDASDPPPVEAPADDAASSTPAAATEGPARKTVKVRPHRGMTLAGAVITGLGLAGRLGIDVFLGTRAGLRASEPYGTWSVGPFFMATTFSNVPTIVGLGLLGGGAYREGHEAGALRGLLPDRRKRQLGLGLLGGGLGLWALSRAIFYPWVSACRTNGCAYGLLESTYYTSAGLVIAGLRLTLRQAGITRAKHERDADYIHITPVFSPTFRGLALTRRF